MRTRPEALSYLGKPLYRESLWSDGEDADARGTIERFTQRQSRVEDPAACVQQATALRTAGAYRLAIAVLTVGLRKWPSDPLLLTERGHAYVNVRASGAALADLTRATGLAPQSFDAWYHLALAQWFEQRHGDAAVAFGTAATVTTSASSRLAAMVWQYTALRRNQQDDQAADVLARIDWDVDLEGRNLNYQLRARFYQRSLTEEDLLAAVAPGTKSEGSLGFGIGVLHLVNGDEVTARRHLSAAATSEFWPAFGAAAAEMELALMDHVDLPTPEAYGALGEPLYAALSAYARPPESVMADLEDSERSLAANPFDTANVRRHALLLASGLARYREAEAFLSRHLAQEPFDAAVLCDRGHYRVNMRRFDEAIADLREAVKLAPEMHDIHYHLGLAHWMLGGIDEAVEAFQRALDLCDSESHQVAYSDWLYLGLRRLGRQAEAENVLQPIHEGMHTTGNNHLYLRRILFYKGDISEKELIASLPDSGLAFASLYGLGCWHLVEGNTARARKMYLDVVERSGAWGGFAHIAAEAELYRGLL